MVVRSLLVLLALTAGCATSQKRPILSVAEYEVLARTGPGAPEKDAYLAAAEKLRAEEVAACASFDERTRSLEPLLLPEQVGGVRWLMGLGMRGAKKVRGAIVVVRSEAKIELEVLQRRVACHLARAAVLGWARPEAASCPLCVRGTTALARLEKGELRIEVRGADAASVDEIWRRARRLSRPGAPDQPAPPDLEGGQPASGPRGIHESSDRRPRPPRAAMAMSGTPPALRQTAGSVCLVAPLGA